MDNFSNMYGFPAAFGFLLEYDAMAMSYFSDLDDSQRQVLIDSEHDFQSKEEMERYLYHLHHEDRDKFI